MKHVEKGDNSIQFDDWEMSLNKEFKDYILWVHIHSHSKVYGDAFACVGDPLACRNCGLEIPKGILMMGLLQRVGLERGK